MCAAACYFHAQSRSCLNENFELQLRETTRLDHLEEDRYRRDWRLLHMYEEQSGYVRCRTSALDRKVHLSNGTSYSTYLGHTTAPPPTIASATAQSVQAPFDSRQPQTWHVPLCSWQRSASSQVNSMCGSFRISVGIGPSVWCDYMHSGSQYKWHNCGNWASGLHLLRHLFSKIYRSICDIRSLCPNITRNTKSCQDHRSSRVMMCSFDVLLIISSRSFENFQHRPSIPQVPATAPQNSLAMNRIWTSAPRSCWCTPPHIKAFRRRLFWWKNTASRPRQNTKQNPRTWLISVYLEADKNQQFWDQNRVKDHKPHQYPSVRDQSHVWYSATKDAELHNDPTSFTALIQHCLQSTFFGFSEAWLHRRWYTVRSQNCYSATLTSAYKGAAQQPGPQQDIQHPRQH